MIDPMIVNAVDKWLDRDCGAAYHAQPMAQDWARIAKVNEEIGEAIAEFIILTGQNPRKPQDNSPEQMNEFLLEMADAALTIIYGMQHFTKDVAITEKYLDTAQRKHYARAMQFKAELWYQLCANSAERHGNGLRTLLPNMYAI